MKREEGRGDDEDEDEEDEEMSPENENESDDEETAKIVENLRVFCVSAVEYLKLQGKLAMDGPAQVCIALSVFIFRQLINDTSILQVFLCKNWFRFMFLFKLSHMNTLLATDSEARALELDSHCRSCVRSA